MDHDDIFGRQKEDGGKFARIKRVTEAEVGNGKNDLKGRSWQKDVLVSLIECLLLAYIYPNAHL